MPFSKKDLRVGLTGALLLVLLGVVQGCDAEPLGVEGGGPECVWIDGMLICT